LAVRWRYEDRNFRQAGVRRRPEGCKAFFWSPNSAQRQVLHLSFPLGGIATGCDQQEIDIEGAQHATFASGPGEHIRVICPREPNVLHTDIVQLWELAQEAAQNIIFEVLVGCEA